MIISTLVQILMADTGVASFVDDRVYPVSLPDAPTYPALVVTKIFGGGQYDLMGDIGIEDARIQIDCYSDAGIQSVIELSTAVRTLLSAYTGGIDSGNPCAIIRATVINDLDLSEESTERSGPRLRRRVLEFHVWNKEV